MSDDRISYVDVVNSIEQLSEILKQKVSSNVFSLRDLIGISKPKLPKRDGRKTYEWQSKQLYIDQKSGKFASGWDLTEIKGLSPSKIQIIHQVAKEEFEKRQKIIDERDEYAEERKKKAFMKVNHQPMYDRMTMNQKEEAWERLRGLSLGVGGRCEFCEWSLPETPRYNSKCERNGFLFKRLDAGLTGQIKGGARYDRMNRKQTENTYVWERDEEISFLSYTKDISFYWQLFPTLRILTACDSCAEVERLLE